MESDDDETYFAKLHARYGEPNVELMFAPKKKETSQEVTWDPSKATSLPPCLAAVALDLREGKKVGHAARFNLAAFLAKRDTSREEIHLFFVNAPNYKKEMTDMQIDSITARGYAPNGCQRMRALGLCRMDSVCQERCIETPLSYPRSAA